MHIKISLPPIPLRNDEGILCHTFCHEWKINKSIINGMEYTILTPLHNINRQNVMANKFILGRLGENKTKIKKNQREGGSQA